MDDLTFPPTLESLKRRDAAEAAACLVLIAVVITVACAALAGLVRWLA